MKTLVRTAAFTLLTLPASAQDTTALATEYVELPAVQEILQDMFSAEVLTAQFKINLTPDSSLSDDQLTRIGILMAKKLAPLRPRMEEAMITASAEIFTAAELEAMIAFHATEHGAAIMTKMQPFMISVMTELGPEMLSIQQRMAPEFMKIIEEPVNQ
ncbi:DUF2059 domain-containing protein [Halovulum sp. GXIMD14793]